jgi:hypothetical protein
MDPNYAFVLSPIDVQCDVPVETIPGHWLARATADQTAAIKRFLTTLGGLHFESHYEFEWGPNPDVEAGESSFRGTRVPEELWRYWVINYEGPNHLSGRLGTAFQLSETPIELGFDAVRIPTEPPSDYGFVSRRVAVFTFFEDLSLRTNRNPLIVTAGLWSDVRELFGLLEVCESEHPEVWRAVQNFELTRMLPRDSTMSALALFAVMESLITHDPKVTFDSLNHQVATKMTLLGKRFGVPLDYTPFGGLSGPEKVWKKIYAYRSAIAHGDKLDFAGELQALQSHQTVLQFVKTAVRRLLGFSVRNPSLVADLKKC